MAAVDRFQGLLELSWDHHVFSMQEKLIVYCHLSLQAKIYTNVQIAHNGSHFCLFSHVPQSEDRVWTKQSHSSIDVTALLSRRNAIVQNTIPRLSPWMSRLCTHTQSVTDVQVVHAFWMTVHKSVSQTSATTTFILLKEVELWKQVFHSTTHAVATTILPCRLILPRLAIYIQPGYLSTWLPIYKVKC